MRVYRGMNGIRIARSILRAGLVVALAMGASGWAQSAGTGTASGQNAAAGQKPAAQSLTGAGTATAADDTAASAKPESLQVANKEYDAVKELARMAKRYGLSKEQKAKIEPLLLEQQKQVHTLGEDTSLTNAEWASAVRKVHQKTVLQVRKLLTDEQLSKYAKDETKRAKQAGNDSDADDDGPPDGPPPDGGPPPGGGGPGGGGPGGGGPPD